jgi:hypothetical protein
MARSRASRRSPSETAPLLLSKYGTVEKMAPFIGQWRGPGVSILRVGFATGPVQSGRNHLEALVVRFLGASILRNTKPPIPT